MACKHIHFCQLAFGIVSSSGKENKGEPSTSSTPTTIPANLIDRIEHGVVDVELNGTNDDFAEIEWKTKTAKLRSEMEATISAIDSGNVTMADTAAVEDLTKKLIDLREKCGYSTGFEKLTATPANKKIKPQRRFNFEKATPKGEGAGRPKKQKLDCTPQLLDVLGQTRAKYTMNIPINK
jgi:hypothetical protein